jgi:ParB-like nuclease domain
MCGDEPARYPQQYACTIAADCAFPIHIAPHHGRMSVLDGVHRLLKADLLGLSTVPAMRLSEADLDAIALKPPSP